MNLTPRYLVAALLVVVLASGAACGMLPERQGPRAATAAAAAPASAVTVRDRSGAPVAGEKAVLQQLKAEGRPDLAEHHLRVLASSGDVDLYRNNTTRLLVDGPATLTAMKAAIARARGRVLLESYIVEDSTVASELADLLLRKAKEGVAVALMYDAVGSIGATDAYFKRLSDGGVAVCKFNPVNPLERPGYWGINHRNHRKVLVVDDEAAFTGGINISRTYASGSRRGGSAGGGSSLSGSGASDEELLTSGWRDTHIELRGPAVPAFARGFTELWVAQGCPGGADKLGLPAPVSAAAPGQRVVKVLQSDPKDATNRIYTSLLAAMDAAQRSIHLTMAYFAPGQDMVDALSDAARRGVDVTLILPGRSDFSLILHAGRSYYTQMLEAGVRIHEIDDAVLHAKTAVIDGVFATVGSSNLDWRSFVTNNEVNVIVLGDDFARELEALFQRDLARARPIDMQTWSRRGVSQRFMEQVGRMAERLL